MIPKIIHQIWLGGELPERNASFIKGVIAMHDGWKHCLWGKEELKNIGIDANALYEHLGSWASVSNLARLVVISLHGGIYLDVDMQCVRPLTPFIVFPAIASIQDSLPCGNASDRICNAFFGAEAHHPWVDWQLENVPKFASKDAVWGVYLMSQAPRDSLTIIPTRMVYPFSWDTPLEFRVAADDSFLIHWWEKRWENPR